MQKSNASPSVPSPADLLDCAIAAARAAGTHALHERNRRQEKHAESTHDVKLVLDRECQVQAANVIHDRYPDHPILGEEISHDRDPDQPRWIVDPIDGTVNFSHGWSIWCCSVAVEHRGETLAGAIYAPALDELYTASIDSPAQLNGKPIRVSGIDDLAQALALTDTDHVPRDFPAGAALYGKFLHAAQKTRVTGSAAIDICRIARGHAESYTALGIYPWDTAAAALILKQAGGQFEVIEQLAGDRFRAIYTNGRVHEHVKAIFLETIAEHIR